MLDSNKINLYRDYSHFLICNASGRRPHIPSIGPSSTCEREHHPTKSLEMHLHHLVGIYSHQNSGYARVSTLTDDCVSICQTRTVPLLEEDQNVLVSQMSYTQREDKILQ